MNQLCLLKYFSREIKLILYEAGTCIFQVHVSAVQLIRVCNYVVSLLQMCIYSEKST